MSVNCNTQCSSKCFTKRNVLINNLKKPANLKYYRKKITFKTISKCSNIPLLKSRINVNINGIIIIKEHLVSLCASALTAAAAHGRLAVCRLLLDQGAAVQQGNRQGVTPLSSAVRRGHWQVRRNQKTSKCIITRSAEQITAAFLLVCQVVELFLGQGVEVNVVDQQGRTALMTAASEGHVSTARLLLDHGNHTLHCTVKRTVSARVQLKQQLQCLYAASSTDVALRQTQQWVEVACRAACRCRALT